MPWYKYQRESKAYYIKDTPKGKRKRAVYDEKGNFITDFGAKGSTIQPGTKKGCAFCARAYRAAMTIRQKWNYYAWSCLYKKSVSKEIFYGMAVQIKASELPFNPRKIKK